MTPSSYRTIFELGFKSFQWARVIQPLIFVALGILFIRLFKNKKYYLGVGVFMASIGSVILILSVVNLIPTFLSLRNSYLSGQSMIAEGIVQDFRPAPILGPAIESFSVNGTLFSYNVLDDTPCFHDAPIHHGPIREGLKIRIHYNANCIQRVDIQ